LVDELNKITAAMQTAKAERQARAAWKQNA
jgi:hypothetical protein